MIEEIGIEESDRKSEPNPEIHKDEDSFLKSIYGTLNY